jgi:hypothetical protein
MAIFSCGIFTDEVEVVDGDVVCDVGGVATLDMCCPSM